MPYFDVTGQADLELLPPGLRKAKDLAFLAEQVEAEVIGIFTLDLTGAPSYRALPPGHPHQQLLFRGRRYTPVADGEQGVFLRGYAEDAAAADAKLRAALARTVARVVAWRLEQGTERVRMVQSVSGQAAGGTNSNITYHAGARDPLPEGWSAPLAAYDTRPAVYGV